MNPVSYRVWSRLTIKSVDEDKRMIEGIATTPSTDLIGDQVDPLGAQYDLPLPFLMDHGENGSDDSIGHVIWAQPTKSGIPIRAKILKSPALPHLDKAWAKLKLGLVRGLSIGFKPLDYEPIKGSSGYRYKRWRWIELSGVVTAANPDCSITQIKSFDQDRAQRRVSAHTNRSSVREPMSGSDYERMKRYYDRIIQQAYIESPVLRALKRERETRERAKAARRFLPD